MKALLYFLFSSLSLNIILLMALPFYGNFFAKKGYIKGYADGFEDADGIDHKNSKKWN